MKLKAIDFDTGRLFRIVFRPPQLLRGRMINPMKMPHIQSEFKEETVSRTYASLWSSDHFIIDALRNLASQWSGDTNRMIIDGSPHYEAKMGESGIY